MRIKLEMVYGLMVHTNGICYMVWYIYANIAEQQKMFLSALNKKRAPKPAHTFLLDPANFSTDTYTCNILICSTVFPLFLFLISKLLSVIFLHVPLKMIGDFGREVALITLAGLSPQILHALWELSFAKYLENINSRKWANCRAVNVTSAIIYRRACCKTKAHSL